MRKASLFVVLSAALVFAAAGSAITNGEPDGNAHPEVGALLAHARVLRRHVGGVHRHADLADASS